MSKVSKSFFWSAIDQFSVQGVQFLLSIIIARLVSPSAYGVVVMVQVFMAFAQIFIDGGFKSALIQKKDRCNEDYYTVFIFNMGIAFVLYAVMFFAAPYIALFYNQPQLSGLTRVIALNLIFSSLSITQMVKIQVALNFKIQAKSRLISVILSGIIGVYCAYKGMEAWALVIQNVLSTFMTSVLLMIFSRWIPRLIFSKDSFNKLFGFGSKILFTNFLTTCYVQITNLIIGKVYSSSQLAYYNRGFSFSQLPSTNIMEVMGRTIYPIFCNLQGNKNALDIAYRKYLRLSVFAIFPILILVGVLSYPLIEILLTPKWLPAAPLLTIFCISFLTYPFLYNTSNYTLALGYATLTAKAAIIKRIISFALLISALFYSVTAVAVSIVISNLLEMFITLYCATIAGMIPVTKQLGFVKDILVVSAISCIFTCTVYILFSNVYLQLFVGFVICSATYLIFMFLFNLEEKDIIITFYRKIKSNLQNNK